jgi:hypothetical protein
MVLAGLALGVFVFASWPDSTTRTQRLPYGESSPKTPPERISGQRAVEATVPAAATPSAADESPAKAAPADEETGRVLAAVDADPSTAWGPAPLKSPLELAPGYTQEAPETLGAEPLPGTALTPGPPPVAR